jgi:subtilisin family serine protease
MNASKKGKIRGISRFVLYIVALTALIAGLLLSATAISAADPPEPTKGPPPTPVPLPPEPVTPHMTEDGRVVVIVFLKRQPLHEVSREVRAEYKSQVETLRAQQQAAAPKLGKGQSLTEEEERRAVRAAPQPSAAQQDEIESLSVRMDALDTEMRSEMMGRARPHLEASQTGLVGAIEEMGGQVIYHYTILNGVVAAIPPEGRAAIEARPEVAEVVDDQLTTGQLDVSVLSIGAGTWWSAGYDGGAYDVGVLDSGVDDFHPGLRSQSFCQQRCLASAGNPGWDPTVDDVNGHGTHVAGIVASTGTAVWPLSGVAHGLDTVFNCKAAFDLDGLDGGSAGMYWSDAMSCVDWALVSNTTCSDFADVMNLSYGGSTSSDDTAYARFWDAVVDDLGVPSTISAGNSGPGANTVLDPSIAYNVMSVANMNDRNTTSRSDDTIASSSSRGPTAGGRKKPDIAAPGTDIMSADNSWELTSDYVSASGTSMAAPHVAGAHLLMTDYNWTQPMVQKAILINTADDWGAAGWDSAYGWGYIDLAEAEFNKDDWFWTTISPWPDYDFYTGRMFNGEKATLVWHRRATYRGDSYPNTYYDLSDVDLRLYREDTGAQVDWSTSSADNVEQVQAGATYDVVIKVDAWSASFDGASTETYALATEEYFSAASGPAFSLGTSNYSECQGSQWSVSVSVNNTGDLAAHSVSASLSVPTGLSIVSGSNPQSLGSIGSGGNQIATWTLSANSVGSYSVPVAINSSSYGESFSGSGSFTADVVATTATPSLYAPSDGGIASGVTPYFDWSSVVGATSYRIQVEDDPSFSSPEIDTTTGDSNYTPSSPLSVGTDYYWRVQASSSCGAGSWTSAWSFTVIYQVYLPLVIR